MHDQGGVPEKHFQAQSKIPEDNLVHRFSVGGYVVHRVLYGWEREPGNEVFPRIAHVRYIKILI